jgi:hypothetical protein
MLQNKCFFKNGWAVISAPSEITASKCGNEDVGVVEQDMVTHTNTVPLSQNVLWGSPASTKEI